MSERSNDQVRRLYPVGQDCFPYRLIGTLQSGEFPQRLRFVARGRPLL